MFGRKMGFLDVFFVVASLGMSSVAFAHPDSLVLTPPLGWNSWNVFHENINEDQIKEVADAMVSSGLKDAGYIYLNLDDNHTSTRRRSPESLRLRYADFLAQIILFHGHHCFQPDVV